MEIEHLYLDLLKKALNNYLYLGGDTPFEQYDTIGLYDQGWLRLLGQISRSDKWICQGG